MIRYVVAVLTAVILMFGTTSCSSVSTEADEVALHYSGGVFSSKKFQNCVPSSDREFDGPGNAHYVYPAGQRTFSFTGKSGSEAEPIAVTTKDGQEVLVPGFVTFTLKTDCDTLRDFHETIGMKYKAYKDGGGWDSFLNDYIYTPLDSAMNKASLEADGWYSLYSDSGVQAGFEESVKSSLPEEVTKALGEDFISISAVQISKPTVGDGLKSGLAAKEEARLQNEAQKEKNVIARTKYDSLKDCRNAGLSEATCVMVYLAESGSIPFYPIPSGGDLNVSPQ